MSMSSTRTFFDDQYFFNLQVHIKLNLYFICLCVLRHVKVVLVACDINVLSAIVKRIELNMNELYKFYPLLYYSSKTEK